MNENNTVLFTRSNDEDDDDNEEDDELNEENLSDVNDIWDDTLLIKTYEKAAKIAMESCKENEGISSINSKKSKKKNKLCQKWKIGDQCRCPYSEDGNIYEADIISIDPATKLCTVKYVGYNNVEKVPLKFLKSSEGESSRLQQIQTASFDYDENLKTSNWSSEKNSKSIQNNGKKLMHRKKNSSKIKQNTILNGSPYTGSSPSQSLNSLIHPPPPPPPPHLFKNICEDKEETEAMSAMLIAWYMSGYHTGYYQGLKVGKKKF